MRGDFLRGERMNQKHAAVDGMGQLRGAISCQRQDVCSSSIVQANNGNRTRDKLKLKYKWKSKVGWDGTR